MMKKIVIPFLLALCIIFIGAESYSLTIGPSRFEVVLPPGEIAGADYYCQNEQDTTVHVIVEPENWHKDIYIYDNLPIESWLQFDTYEFDLRPKEIKKLRMTLKIPRNAKGELCAQIFFSSEVKRENKNPDQGSIQARLGAVLYVAIKGTEVVDAEIVSVNASKITKMSSNEPPEVMFETSIKNKGNVHLKPTGKVVVTDDKGQKVAEAEMVPGYTLLPYREDAFKAYYKKGDLKAGSYKMTASITFGEAFGEPKSASMERGFDVAESGEIILK